jgi:hypothetical protein
MDKIKKVNTDSDSVITYFSWGWSIETQTRTAILIFLRLKLLVPRIIDLCFTYQSLLGPRGLDSNWGRYTESHFYWLFSREISDYKSEFIFTFWSCPEERTINKIYYYVPGVSINSWIKPNVVMWFVACKFYLFILDITLHQLSDGTPKPEMADG